MKGRDWLRLALSGLGLTALLCAPVGACQPGQKAVYLTFDTGHMGVAPLIATLLLDLLRRERPDARVQAFTFKALRPTFDTHPFSVHGQPAADGRTVRLWASDHAGWLTMDATATLA